MFLENFFESSVKTFPNNTAIEEGEKQYTYLEAEKKANKLANYLKGLSIGPEDKVTILLPRCAEVTIAMLGILKSGAAYIPLDPEIPADRVNFIMEDANSKLLITSNEILDRIGGQLSSFPIFNIDKQTAELDNFPDTKPIVEGLVQPKSIDWARSTGIKIQFSEEKEITVLQDEPIEIYDIIYYNNKGKEKHIPLKQSIIMQA